jgi:hypothetical protein
MTHVAFLGPPGACYREWTPPAELARRVAVVWRIEAATAFELRIVPDGFARPPGPPAA